MQTEQAQRERLFATGDSDYGASSETRAQKLCYK